MPLGILGAVYLNEYGGSEPFARLVRFMANVMTGVPSIVMGLFVYVAWTLRFGYSAFGGALALACLMLPVVIRCDRADAAAGAATLREASYALGDSQEPHDPHGRPAGRPSRHRQRLPARDRARRRARPRR